MADDYKNKEDIYFRDSTSLDSKINRIIEKNFFLEIKRILNYGGFFEIESEEQVQENGLRQATVLSNLLYNLENEIEDSLALMTKEQGFIYLSKLYDKTERSIENIKGQLNRIRNNNFEDFLGLRTEEVEKRKDIIEVANYLNGLKITKLNKLMLIVEGNLKYYKAEVSGLSTKLKWLGGPSQLGFIISSLVDLGYIEAPKKQDGDINYTQFAKLVKQIFDVNTTESTLSKYLNQDSEKGQEPMRKFNENGFNIPHKSIVS